MPSDCCYFVDKAAAAAAAPALKYFALFYTALRFLHRIWDRPENKALFLRFCNAYAEFMGESELGTFITGFRLGARFMLDTFLGDDVPFERF